MDAKAQALLPWLTEVYRALHRVPEVGRDLPETTAFVTARLDEMGVAWRPCAGGVLAELPAPPGGPLLALRADMDALPVDERTGLPWASERPGAMHACGHDAHTACALGALRLLKEGERPPSGLRVLFQPDEEGDGGAARMIADGALDGVTAALALHVAPDLPAGKVAAANGRVRAASDMFTVTLRGRGCHGAYPHTGIDAVVGGAQILVSLQTLVSRETDPLDSVALTVGHFEAGHARNVIPDTARFDGIIRTLTPRTRRRVRSRLAELVEGMARALRLTAETTVVPGYPPVVNDPAEAARARKAAAALLGPENVVVPEFPQMGVDDFAYLAEKVPGCYAELGCLTPGRAAEPLHSPRFFPDENCLPVGAALVAAWARGER